MKSVPKTEIEIMSIIKSFKPKNSAGCKGTSWRILKRCAYIISTSFSHICNSSHWNLVFIMRGSSTQLLSPYTRKVIKTNTKNSRPISLLTTLSKILQRVMFNTPNQHLWVNNVFIPKQFGFRKGSTIENAVFILTNNILTVLGEQKQTAAIFMWLDESVWLCKTWHSFRIIVLLWYMWKS